MAPGAKSMPGQGVESIYEPSASCKDIVQAWYQFDSQRDHRNNGSCVGSQTRPLTRAVRATRLETSELTNANANADAYANTNADENKRRRSR
jgi:hypothetical protein